MFQQHPAILRVLIEQHQADLRQQAHEQRFNRLARQQRRQRRRRHPDP
ncbi:MAG: hypothetical protein ACR2HP_15190 [Ilumatobacteraceae bacterium]